MAIIMVKLLAALCLGLLTLLTATAADELPRIVVYATGGTIAGKSDGGSSETTKYSAGQVTAQQLLDAVPEIANVSHVDAVQFTNLGSNRLNTSLVLELSKNISASLASDKYAGAVVTMGTDTLEEVAYFLDLTVDSPKPVVIVGAMRPTTALSADGPMNLLQAIRATVHPSSRSRGALVVLNDRIGSAYYTTKTNSRTLDTFKAIEQGYLGTFVGGGEPLYYFSPSRPTGRRFFNISALHTLPKVDILYGYLDMDPALLRLAVEHNGAAGIVIAGEGDGEADRTWLPEMVCLMARGVPVVTSTRTAAGTVGAGLNFGNGTASIPASTLNPPKAKLLLQLALAQHPGDVSAVASAFKGV